MFFRLAQHFYTVKQELKLITDTRNRRQKKTNSKKINKTKMTAEV